MLHACRSRRFRPLKLSGIGRRMTRKEPQPTSCSSVFFPTGTLYRGRDQFFATLRCRCRALGTRCQFLLQRRGPRAGPRRNVVLAHQREIRDHPGESYVLHWPPISQDKRRSSCRSSPLVGSWRRSIRHRSSSTIAVGPLGLDKAAYPCTGRGGLSPLRRLVNDAALTSCAHHHAFIIPRNSGACT